MKRLSLEGLSDAAYVGSRYALCTGLAIEFGGVAAAVGQQFLNTRNYQESSELVTVVGAGIAVAGVAVYMAELFARAARQLTRRT